VEQKAELLCQLYGYKRIDTPLFEEAELFARSVGEETEVVQKQMYTFEDRGGAQMTLRPEGTAPVCRAYVEHGMHTLPQPVKLYYIAPIFRYERPQAGRYREHRQFGFEAIGESDPLLDVEVITMAWQFCEMLGIQGLSLKLNSIGCRRCRPAYVEALKGYYSRYTDAICPNCKTRLVRNPLRLLDCKEPPCRNIAESAPKSVDYLCEECRAHFGHLKSYLDLMELSFELDYHLVRGLDYYTRTVFEIQTREEGAQNALGGGGRYDYLVEELGGNPTPAVGFAAGLERIISCVRRQDIPVPPPSEPKVYIAYLGERAKREATELVTSLRKAGIPTIQAVGDRSLKAQMRQANSLGTTYGVIIGEKEVEGGTVMLRDMSRGEQREIALAELVSLLRKKEENCGKEGGIVI
jgi:histidyl-tRNA synthetase